MDGVIPSHAFNEQLKKVVRESIRRDRGPAPRQGRWHKKGSGNCCQPRWELWIQATGLLSSGTFDLELTFPFEGDDVTETITVDHDVTAVALKAAIEAAHEAISTVAVSGGALDRRSIVIGTADSNIKDIQIGASELTAGRVYLIHRYKSEDLIPDDVDE